jgi:hypothetical protein
MQPIDVAVEERQRSMGNEIAIKNEGNDFTAGIMYCVTK